MTQFILHPTILKHRFLKLLLTGFLLLFSMNLVAQEARKGMLLLGSADKTTLIKRVEIAAELYQNQSDFDYIIVSGGCGAHDSSICEATEMFELLQELGVPSEIIHKEEKAKTTVQNYTYSRSLRTLRGEKIIQPQDHLIVVSNHWHAMSVAARLAEHDGLKAEYYIKGDIKPGRNAKADYSNIYDNDLGTEAYAHLGHWPKVDLSLSVPDQRGTDSFYWAIADLVYKGSSSADTTLMAKDTPEYQLLQDLGKVDASFFIKDENNIYFLQAGEFSVLNLQNFRMQVENKPLEEIFTDLPAPFSYGFIDAASYYPDSGSVFLFKADSVLQVNLKTGVVEKSQKIKSWLPDWPFGWGSGDVDAARFDSASNRLILHRGQEYLEISLNPEARIMVGPTRLRLDRPASLLEKN